MIDWNIERYPTPEAVRHLTAALGLPPEFATSQDWDLFVASVERLPEYVEYYVQAQLDDDARFALMQLILASLDEALAENRASPELVADVQRLLRENMALHAPTVRRWSLVGREDEIEDEFPVTPYMKRLMLESSASKCERDTD